MTIHILSENGRGRHLAGWALERGFQVSMALFDVADPQDLPFGEKILDTNQDWAQVYIAEVKNAQKKPELCEMGPYGPEALAQVSDKALFSSWFDLGDQQSGKTKADSYWQRDWDSTSWQNQLSKLKNLGLEINSDSKSQIGWTFDFRSNLHRKPLWHWVSAEIEWDTGIYQDVIPNEFVWVKNQNEYLVYENFVFMQKTKQPGGYWKAFFKLPYAEVVAEEQIASTMTAWTKGFRARWPWVNVKWSETWQSLPFYQWKKEKSFAEDDFGPHVLGSYRFEKQWQLEQKIFNALVQSMNQKRKKNVYDFKVLEA